MEDSLYNTLLGRIGITSLQTNVNIANPSYYTKLGSTILLENHTRPFFSCEEKIENYRKYDSSSEEVESIQYIIKELNYYIVYSINDKLRDYFSSSVKKFYELYYRRIEKVDETIDGAY